jgi:hypothetical protein
MTRHSDVQIEFARVIKVGRSAGIGEAMIEVVHLDERVPIKVSVSKRMPRKKERKLISSHITWFG